MQPLAPTSRRQSQQRETAALASVGLSAPHPYANAPSSSGYRSGGGYGRHSPNAAANGLPVNGLNGSESFLYGQVPGKNEGASGIREMNAPGAVKGMTVYDRSQMRSGDQDEDGHGRRKGILSALCCRT